MEPLAHWEILPKDDSGSILAAPASSNCIQCVLHAVGVSGLEAPAFALLLEVHHVSTPMTFNNTIGTDT
jgi:hypothetical protein